MPKVKVPFNGPAYKGPSNNINAQECVNFCHIVDRMGGKGELSLIGRFGLDLYHTVGSEPIRGGTVVNNVLYFASGNKMFSINLAKSVTKLGDLDTSSGYMGFAHNGLEVVAVDGVSGYSYVIASANFAKITDGDFYGGNDVQYLDHFFIVDNLTGGTSQVSALDDGRTWSALDRATAEADPDGLVRCMSIHSILWMFGESTAEPWYNAALPSGFPLLRQSSSVVDMGLAARWGAVKADNTIYFLAQNKDGLFGIARLNGASAEKISTLPLDNEIRGYSRIDDCVAFSFMTSSHSFVVFTFPTAGKTWAFDASVGLWAEWRSWEMSSFRCAFHFFINGKNILGDRATGKLFEINWNSYQDVGEPIERVRTTQHQDANGNEVEYNQLEVFAETGVGPAEAEGAEEPVLMLSVSDDGGYEFSNELWRSLGWQGQYKKRLIWTRQGSSRDRIWRLRATGNFKTVIMGAVAEITVGAD